MKLTNKTVVVTGAGNGMGRQLTLQLLQKGNRVAAVDMNQNYLEETKNLAGVNADKLSLHLLDITDKAHVATFPEEVIKIHGAVDGLINNAGIIQPFVKLMDLDWKAIDKVMEVNFFGMLNMTKAFLPHLIKRPSAHIANTSSMGGFLPVPGQSVYGASKAAVKLLTEGLYAELKSTNVRVTIIFPGAIQTNITQNSGIDMPKSNQAGEYKTLSAEKAASIIIEGIEKDKFRVLVGSDSRMMDLFYRLNPKFATNLIAKRMASLLK